MDFVLIQETEVISKKDKSYCFFIFIILEDYILICTYKDNDFTDKLINHKDKGIERETEPMIVIASCKTKRLLLRRKRNKVINDNFLSRYEDP
jgi:hypothetical protein